MLWIEVKLARMSFPLEIFRSLGKMWLAVTRVVPNDNNNSNNNGNFHSYILKYIQNRIISIIKLCSKLSITGH